jgi:branched-chain amino acid transport system permease protein
MTSKSNLQAFVQSKTFIVLVVILAFAIFLPALIKDSFLLTVFTSITFFSIYAASWNFLANSGQGSLGHAAFLGIGGFSAALIGGSLSSALASYLGTTQIPIGALSVTVQVLVIVLGGLLSSAIGLLIGLACVRLKAWYLAMVTFGFSVIAASIFGELDFITHGKDGFAPLTLVPKGLPFYVLSLSFAVVSILAMYLLMKSRMGFAFKAIHGNEAEAKMIGINTAKYKLFAFVISTFFAGIAGGLNAYYIQFIDNSVFSAANSFTPLMMSVIGGLGTTAGPIIGAAFLVSVQQTLSLSGVSQFFHVTIGPYFHNVAEVGPPISFLLIGIFLVVIVIFAPKGLVSLFRKVYVYFTTDEAKKEVKAK